MTTLGLGILNCLEDLIFKDLAEALGLDGSFPLVPIAVVFGLLIRFYIDDCVPKPNWEFNPVNPVIPVVGLDVPTAVFAEPTLAFR